MATFNLVTRLTTVLKDEVNKHALELSSCCIGRFRRLIKSGVKRMEVADVTKNQVMVYLAEVNIKRLVVYLTSKARGKGSFPNIGDKTLETALEECHPLWPYKQIDG